MLPMTYEQAKALLAKELKDMTPEEKLQLPLAIKIVTNKWATPKLPKE